MKPIVILGTTSIGKTKTAVSVAEKINAEIISADSMQIYKFMDIGTAKPSKEQQKTVKHHLIDFKMPDEDFSAGEFIYETNNIINRLSSEGKNTIIVGGTGFYIDALINGLNYIKEVDKKIKLFFDDVCEEMGTHGLFKWLQVIDEAWAKRIGASDCQRIKRGLSVYVDSKETLSSFFSMRNGKESDKFNIIVLYASKEYINSRIDARVEKMREFGLVDEVKTLVDMGYANTNAMKAIGYKEILSYLSGEIDKKEAFELIKKNTKAYAKRQMTLLRSRFKKELWVDVENENTLEAILAFCRPSP